MLNTFPDLLVYGFFAPMVLRVAVALAFGFIVFVQIKRRKEIADIHTPLLGRVGDLWVWVSVVITALIALALLFGWHTQLAAILGIILCLKHAWFAKRYARAIPLCRGEYVLLIVILLSLLISGAGALARDLPL